MDKGFKFRIFPNKEQINIIHKTFGCTRFVYNFFLAMNIDNYNFVGKGMTYEEYSDELTNLKEIYSFLYEVDSSALQQSLKNLNKAFKNFFKRKDVGFPKFKSKFKSSMSYKSVKNNDNIRIEGKYIKLPKLGKVKMKQHRSIY